MWKSEKKLNILYRGNDLDGIENSEIEELLLEAENVQPEISNSEIENMLREAEDAQPEIFEENDDEVVDDDEQPSAKKARRSTNEASEQSIEKEIEVSFEIIEIETATLLNSYTEDLGYTEITDVLRRRHSGASDSGPSTTEKEAVIGRYLMEFAVDTKDEKIIEYITDRLYYIQDQFAPPLIKGIYQIGSSEDEPFTTRWFIVPMPQIEERYFYSKFKNDFSSLLYFNIDDTKIVVVSDADGKIYTYNPENHESIIKNDESVHKLLSKIRSETNACIEISVEYANELRGLQSPVPVFHNVSLRYIRPPENVKEVSDYMIDALEAAVRKLKLSYDMRGSFVAVSPSFKINTNVDDIKALKLDVSTPDKFSENPSYDFCQHLITILANDPGFSNFRVTSSSEEPPLDFSELRQKK